MSEAGDVVRQLLDAGFSQTDIARGLGLMSKGSGSYVGQVLRGTKGGNKLAELRALLGAVREAGGAVPQGRANAQARQELLSGVVRREPRKAKSGRPAAVRKAAVQVSQRGYIKATAALQSIKSSGAAPVEDAVRALGQYPGGKFAFTIVGRFAKESPAHRSKYWRQFYGKHKRNPARRRGSKNVLEATFGNAGRGFSAPSWVVYLDDAGSFLEAARRYADANGYDWPDQVLRVELSGWVEGGATPNPA